MPFQGTRQLPGEPILITTYEGVINAETVQQGSMEVAKLMATIDGPIYAVVDVSTITTSFGDVMQMLKHQSSGESGTTTDPKLAAMALVGSNAMAKLYAAAMNNDRYGAVQIPMFTTLDDALAALRIMIANANAKKQESA